MAEEGREVNQARGDVDSGSVPPQQRPHSEGMTQAMQPGRRHPRWWGECRVSGHYPVERLSNRARMDRASSTEGEQRRVGLASSAGFVLKLAQMLGQLCFEPRSEGDEPVFGELRLTDAEHAAIDVDILQLQPGDLSDA